RILDQLRRDSRDPASLFSRAILLRRDRVALRPRESRLQHQTAQIGGIIGAATTGGDDLRPYLGHEPPHYRVRWRDHPGAVIVIRDGDDSARPQYAAYL